MQLLALMSLALAISASPISHTRHVHPRDDCSLGQLYCKGADQWALCGPSGLVWQAVALGTACQNGQIVTAGGAGTVAGAADPAPVPAPAPSPTAATAPAPASSTPDAPAPSTASPATAPAENPPAMASTLPVSAPASTLAGGSTAANAVSYKMYTGDGSTAKGWPAMSDWKSFDDLFAANKDLISNSCTQFGQPNNSDEETQHLKDSINEETAESGVDNRFILAIVMQESKGCVRVWSTKYSVTNPGLLQSHEGTGTCNDGIQGAGKVQNPCPKAVIKTMIHDGAVGTPYGDGLKSLGAHGDDAKAYYTTARKYNSGSVAPDGDLSSPQSVATKCYASDVANRLIGFVGTSACNLDNH